MSSLRKFLEESLMNVKKLSYVDKFLIVDNDEGRYLFKRKDSNKRDIFSYLRQVGYDYYMPIVNDYNDAYEVYPYYDDNINDDYLKAKELLYALAVLHLRTTSYVEWMITDAKEIYEKIDVDIDLGMKYYLDLQDYLEGKLFLSPGEYLLINNISKIYSLFRISKRRLDSFYESFSGKVREAVLVGNVSLSNFRVGDKNYFIDFRNSKKDLVIYDLVDFYRNEATSVNFPSLFNLYNSKYQLNQNEFDLFCALISLCDKFKFSKDNYKDTLRVRKLVDYVNVTLSFLSEKEEENQKAHEEKLEQEY